jgi:DNA repair photolyase
MDPDGGDHAGREGSRRRTASLGVLAKPVERTAVRQNLAVLRDADPPNQFDSMFVEYEGEGPPVELRIYEDRSKSILSKNTSPDLGFSYSVNAYRGCFHGCAYCYARRTHEYLGFTAGVDFERRLLVKRDAASLLRKAFESPRWKGELVLFSGNTDAYQPLESRYGLTRACLEVCLEYRNPVHVITKSPLVERDVELLAALTEQAHCGVTVSIPFWDVEQARAIEPYVATPARRLAVVKKLSQAGIPVSVNVAPVIPGLNDDQIPRVLEAAAENGARSAAFILLRLPGAVAPVFEARLRQAFPDRAERVLARMRETHGGKLNDAQFFDRMRGHGNYAEAIERLFLVTSRRLGLATGMSSPADGRGRPAREPEASVKVRREAPGTQLKLF